MAGLASVRGLEEVVVGDDLDGDEAEGDDDLPEGEVEEWDIERAVLNDSPVGRQIASGFVRSFGAFISNEVRPLLREVADGGGEPQLLVNGLAQLLRATADSIEFPLDHPRAGRPPT